MLVDPRLSIDAVRRRVLLGMAGILPVMLFRETVAQGATSHNQKLGLCAAPKRVAVMAPWITETMQAMGVEPIAVPEARRERRSGRVAVSEGVIDLGFVGEPNLEMLARLRPDLILIDGTLQGERWRRVMSAVAPVEMFNLFLPERNPWRTTGEQAFHLADAIGCPGAARRLLAESSALVERAREAVAGMDTVREPWFVARMNDARNFNLFCKGSVLHDVLELLGLTNASNIENDWGYFNAGIDRLAAQPAAGIILIDTPPHGAKQGMGQYSLWRQLPAVREGRVHVLNDLYMFGAIPTGVKFARLLATSLTGKPFA